MSSNKRRKIDSADAPAAPLSAVSAIAARRQLATLGGEATHNPESASEPLSGSRVNAYSALQNLKDPSDSSKPPRNPGPKSSPGRSQAATHAGGRGGDAVQSDNQTASKPLEPRLVQYSSFRLSKENHRVRSDGVVELRLSHSERFVLLGSYGLQVLSGEASVCGAVFQPSEQIYWIQAPLSSAIPVVRTAENTRVKLHPDANARGSRRLARLSPLFRGVWDESLDDKDSFSRASTFRMAFSSEDAPKKALIHSLVSLPEWNKRIAMIVPHAKLGSHSTLVCGPKSSGKSTFSKLLMNRVLTAPSLQSVESAQNSVFILDLDPGQPEYTPPGLISLIRVTKPNLGPPFTHPGFNDPAAEVIRCHALASVTPAMAPEFYIEAATDLLSVYSKISQGCSLLVNTPGWILGTGLDLLVQLISIIAPKQVIYMSEDGPAETVEVLRDVTTLLTTLPSQQSEFTSRTAAHLRAMQTMSYFHSELGHPTGSPRLEWHSSPLSNTRPWQIQYSGHGTGILGILSYDAQSPPELLCEAINGMVLAAVEVEDVKALRDLAGASPSSDHSHETISGTDTRGVQSLVSRTAEDLPFIPNPGDVALDPRYSRTIGLVLIRGIDTKAKALQVLTPICSQKVANIRAQSRHIILLHGKFDTPSWAYTEDLYERSGPPAENADKTVEVTEEDTSEDDSGAEPEQADEARDVATMPWVEVLRKDEKRPVGSRVWRVRRDLGRSSGGD